MRKRVINPRRGMRARAAEIVNADPRQYLIWCPLIVVRPVVEFLVDPREEPDGGVEE
jgi:hypothetical protein